MYCKYCVTIIVCLTSLLIPNYLIKQLLNHRFFFIYCHTQMTVKQALIDKSLWNSLISNVETELIKLFEEKGSLSTSNIKPQQPEMIELINKLIFEYMDWMGYKLTNSVFIKESGTEINMKTNRKYMASQLDLEDDDITLRLPLLTVLLTMIKNKDGDKEALDG